MPEPAQATGFESADADPASLSEHDLELRLARLVELDQTISRARKQLHARIDAPGQAQSAPEMEEQRRFDGLLEEERRLSRRRHLIHWLIDETRAEMTSRTGHGGSTRA